MTNIVEISKPKRMSQKQEAASNETLPDRLAALAELIDVAVQRIVAKNPSTPPNALEILSHSSDKATRKAVTGNPNTPAQIMTELGEQFPLALLNNPALDMMLFENPDLFSEMPQSTLRSIAKRENCSPAILGHLSKVRGNGGLLLSLMQNENTPHTVVKSFAECDPSAQVEISQIPEVQVRLIQEAARIHVALKQEVQSDEALKIFWDELTRYFPENSQKCLLTKPVECHLIEAALIPDSVRLEAVSCDILQGKLIESIIRRITLPVPFLEVIASLDAENLIPNKWQIKAKKRLLTAIGKLPKAPAWLKGHKTSFEAVKAIQEHAEKSRPDLIALSRNGGDGLTLLLAKHPLAGEVPAIVHALQKLANDKLAKKTNEIMNYDDYCMCVWVMGLIGGNKIVPAETLEALLDWRLEGVVEAIVLNPAIPIYLIEKLLIDEDPWARYHASGSPLISKSVREAILDSLAEEKDFGIRRIVASSIDSPARALMKLSSDTSEYVRTDVANNQNAPEMALKNLAADSTEKIRDLIANNPNVTGSILGILAEDVSVTVRRSVAKHPNSTEFSLNKLAEDIDVKVRVLVANNPNSPSELLISLAGDIEVSVRRLIANNPNSPSELLIRLAEDEDPLVRLNVARNTNCPLELVDLLLLDLANEKNHFVRADLASIHNLSIVILEILAVDENRRVRSSVAGNPNTPISILETLVDDPDSYVGEVAKKSLTRLKSKKRIRV